MKNDNIKKNSITSVCVQIGAIAQGLIIPRLLLENFGSDINGLISSISQFLNFFSIIEGGVIGVILASLYLPVASKDEKKMGAVLGAANKFLRKLALLFVCYTLILGMIYPLLNKEFSWVYTFSLILIISSTTLIQYYYTIIPQLILRADNKIYISNIVCLVFIIINVIASVICVKIIPQIHIIKLVSALVYLLQPILLNLYTKKHYQIKIEENVDKTLIKNRWNGLGASVANLITTNTDVILLTWFSSFSTISIYTVYYMVINSIRNLISSIGMGYQSLLGQQIAMKNEKLLNSYFNRYEFVTYNCSGIVLSSCTCLIVPFVMIYTKGVTDANYYQPLFAILICLAQYIICIREPYIQLTYCAGLFKETQNIAFIEAGINIGISIILVFRYGIIGVAIGTVISVIYRFSATVVFLRCNVINRKIWVTLRKLLIYFFVATIDVILGWSIVPKNIDVVQWLGYGVLVFIISLSSHGVVSFIVFKNELMSFLPQIRKLND